MAGILFIISAPSGSGKSTLVGRLRPLAKNLDFSVSYTTRHPRGSEQNAMEYHFTDRATFKRMVADGEFLEHAEVFGNYYGTACHSLIDAKARGNDLLLDIDVQGAAQIRKKISDAVSIFILPPNPDVLEMRLRSRSCAEGAVSPETDQLIERRLAQARHEIENYREYSYILVNDNLEKAVEELEAIVKSERIRRGEIHNSPDSARILQLAEECRQANARQRLQPVLAAFGLLDTEGIKVGGETR